MGEFIRQGLHVTINNHGDFKIYAPHSHMAWSRDTAMELAQFIVGAYWDLDFPEGAENTPAAGNFHEEDEPIQDVKAAWVKGQPVVTAPSSDAVTLANPDVVVTPKPAPKRRPGRPRKQPPNAS